MESATLFASTFAIRTSHSADQKLQKSLQSQPRKEIIKNAPRTKRKRVKYFEEALEKAATKTQQWL